MLQRTANTPCAPHIAEFRAVDERTCPRERDYFVTLPAMSMFAALMFSLARVMLRCIVEMLRLGRGCDDASSRPLRHDVRLQMMNAVLLQRLPKMT